MRFTFTKQQEMLRKSFAEFLSAKCKPEDRHAWSISEDGFSRKIWQEVAELGWPGLIYEEQYGGMGGSFIEAVILFEELGKHLFPGPLFASAIMAGALIETAGSQEQKEAHLPDLLEGNIIFTLALLDTNGHCDADSPALSAVKVGPEEFQLEGSRLLVPYAHVASKIIVCANVSEGPIIGPTLFIVERGGKDSELIPLNPIDDSEKLYAVRFKRTRVNFSDLLGGIGQGRCHIDRLLPKMIILKCAEMIGGIKKVLDMTVSYAKARHQFGRPIGSFQAIQHYCADMAVDLEVGRLITYHAATLIDDGRNCTKELAMAKAWCSDAYPRCCEMSHRIHGAYGVTEECDLHLYTKHAKTAELMFGHSWFYRSKVADSMGL